MIVKKNLEKETNNADDDEYIDYPPLQIDNIKSQSHENIGNILLLKRFLFKLLSFFLNISIFCR